MKVRRVRTDGNGTFFDFLVEHFAEFTAEGRRCRFDWEDVLDWLLIQSIGFTIQQSSVHIDLGLECNVATRGKRGNELVTRRVLYARFTFAG